MGFGIWETGVFFFWLKKFGYISRQEREREIGRRKDEKKKGD